MAINYLTVGVNQGLVLGLSTDTKPATTCVDGHVFIEVDTWKIFRRETGSWVEKLNTSYSVSGHSHSGLAPTGGASGQVLKKSSASNYDYGWADDLQGASNQAFPVGSVFIAVVSTNPATLLGYGTWSAFAAGRMLVGLDSGQTEFDVVEETGGAKTHTLLTTEMPAHTHVQNAHTHTQDAHTHVQNSHTHTYKSQTATTGSETTYEHGVVDTSSTGTAEGGITEATTAVNQNTTATNQNTTAVNQSTGGGGAHNNMPPYIVVYMWKRTA